MQKTTGGQMTKGGVYVSLRSGEFITVPRKGGELPGEASVTYIRTPAAIAAVVGPIIGLTYVIFLPLIGLITLAWLIGRLVGRGFWSLRVKTAELRGAEWQPGMSYFARRRKAREQRKETGAIEELQKEIEQKKQQQG